MLTADEANEVLAGLRADVARTADGDNSGAPASSIAEVTQWIETLAEEAAAEAMADAAAEHAADLFADHLAGI